MNFDTTQLMAIAAGLGWASGLRLYAVVFLAFAGGALIVLSVAAGSVFGRRRAQP